MDIQMLARWFKKGYSSREMAMFLLIAETHGNTAGDEPLTPEVYNDPEEVATRFEELHTQVVKHVFKS